MQTVLRILRHHGLYLRIAEQWDNNLRLQGFAEAFERQQPTPPRA